MTYQSIKLHIQIIDQPINPLPGGTAMTDKNESRYFLIEHKDCGSILTIKSDIYNNVAGPRSTPFVCPSCLDSSQIDQKELLPKFKAFFNAHKNLADFLEDKGFTIREIKQENLEAIKKLLKYEELEAIKNLVNLLHKPLDKS